MSMSTQESNRYRSGEERIECDCGRTHWGFFGAAGLFLVRRNEYGEVTHIVLQHRAGWSDGGNTWGIPGGALSFGEEPIDAALRESKEEAGINSHNLRILGTSIVTHGNWSYTTVIAETTGYIHPKVVNRESLAVEWVEADKVNELPLLPAFASGWNTLRARIDQGEFNS